MSRVVLDTNVVFAAFATRGLCESTFELCLESHTLVVSNFLIEELRQKLVEKLGLPLSTVEEILSLYKARSQTVESVKVEPNACRDSDDIQVLGTCVGGRAEFLVTGDKDLLVLETFGETRILSPRQFYESQR